MTTNTNSTVPLAIDGGPKAFAKMRGKKRPKIGIEEFMSIAERFGFSANALARIRSAISEEDLGAGPTLSRFATANRRPPRGLAFEKVAREILGVKYAMGVSSGTGALHAAMVAVGVGPGMRGDRACDRVLCHRGGRRHVQGGARLRDVDQSLGMDPRKIEPLITPRTVAIVPTCVMGAVPDMDPILAAARKHHLKVIEDGRPVAGGEIQGPFHGHARRYGLLQHLRL